MAHEIESVWGHCVDEQWKLLEAGENGKWTDYLRGKYDALNEVRELCRKLMPAEFFERH